MAGLPTPVLARPPAIPFWKLILIGLFLFTGQFLLLFFGMAFGTPPGVASVIIRAQALFHHRHRRRRAA